MTPEQKKFLDARSTPYILRLMRQNLCDWDYDDESGAEFDCYDSYIENGRTIRIVFSVKELKEYLATRPHVMNKKESRAAIKQRKASGISRRKVTAKKKRRNHGN